MLRRCAAFAVVLLASAALLSPLAARAWLAKSGEEMTARADKFLAALNAEEAKKATMAYDDPKRVDWHFIPKKERKGLQIREMSDSQKQAAHALLKACLSEIGYDKATKIMELEELLHELETKKKANVNIRDTQRYYFTVFGKPAADGKWGLSIEGHHLTLNFVVEKNKVISSTPTVFCTNPAVVMTDLVPKFKGRRVLEQEETLAFELLASLTAEQRKIALTSNECPKEVRAAGEAQPPQEAPIGISAAKLTSEQAGLLRKLIGVYCHNLPEDVAAERLAGIDAAGFDKVHFAWMGAQKPGVGHYYRIQGPTFVIELVNLQPDADGNPANHVHSIYRNLAGDFALPVKEPAAK